MFKQICCILLIFFMVTTPCLASYTEMERNFLLANPIAMTMLDCIQKYGAPDFCDCKILESSKESGEDQEVCVYKKPPVGFYTLAKCESLWGKDNCMSNVEGVSPDSQAWQLNTAKNKDGEFACKGNIFFFNGEKLMCRKKGLIASENCCKKKNPASKECSFEDFAGPMGIPSAMIQLAQDAASFVAASLVKDQLYSYVGSFIVNNAAPSIVQFLATTGTSSLSMSTSAFSSVYGAVSSQGLAATQTGTALAMESTFSQGAYGAANQIASAVAANLAAMISIVSWAYTAWTLYNMYVEMSKCNLGEAMLGCKIGANLCVHTGNKCKIKIFDSCVQDQKVFCCFKTELAKILHEQGRPLIGMSWGSGGSPNCRGFTPEEFMRIDLGKIDFSAYEESIMRQTNTNIKSQVTDFFNQYNQ